MRAWNRYVALAALGLLGLMPASPALAVVTATWNVQSYKDWDQGEAESAFITSQGEVKPGWDTRRIDLEVDGVWAALRLPDDSLLLGTDDEGSIYRLSGDKAQKLVTIEGAVAVVSLALGKDGTVYAGTMPGGEVWAVDARAGKARKLATLDGAETVWSLAMDAAGKALYAGTGPDGKLFAIEPATGKARVAFETEDRRITALLGTRDGAIWLGTSEKAVVFRHDPARGTTRAMADFSGNEITAMAEADGSVLVVANDFDEPTTTGVKTRSAVSKADKKPKDGETAKMPDKGTQPGADTRPTNNTEPERKNARKGKGALYRVRGDGSLEQLHALSATYFTSVVVTETGTIFAGAGDKGRIYLVDTDDSVSTAFDVDERIVGTLTYDARQGLTFTTSDAAAIYRAQGKAKKATYLSDVHDTSAPSRFGTIVWHGSGDIRVETRTGNTAEPGKGWSEFEAPRSVTAGGAGSRSGQIASPSGRYIQFRVTFPADDRAAVRAARIYYLPQNRPTRITGVEVKPGEEVKGVTLKEGATKAREPVLKLDWSVENPDSDETRYKLEVRREGEALWRPIIPGKKSVTTTKYSWNTETFPDGYYRLRVIAIDDRGNSPDRAHQSERTTDMFLVDNERPRIDGISVAAPAVTARAVDSMSAIAEVAYSVDDGPWHVGTTSDGIFDGTAEMLRIRLPDDLTPGMHTLAIRVADEAGNIGSAAVTFQSK